jgi:hypothetical protein
MTTTNNTTDAGKAWFEAQFAAIAALAKNAEAAHEEAAIMARKYLDFGLQSGNLDLLRMTREALASAPALQSKLDVWLKNCSPVKKVTKKNGEKKTVSYQKDKVRVRKVGGFRVFDETVYSVSFVTYKAPKKDKPSMTVVQCLEMLGKALDGALGRVPDDVEGDDLDNAKEYIAEAANKIEAILIAMTAPAAVPTQAEIVALVTERAQVA